MRKVFIDCGANTCKVLRESIKNYPDREFFAFEAQPELAIEGEKVIEEYPDTPITFINKAVWVRDQSLQFYLATQWGPNHKGGSTLVQGQTKNSSQVDYNSPVTVEAIDFSKWLGANFSEEDDVIIKMDIEGAEYDVIEDIIEDNNHTIINEMIVEFHQEQNELITEERHEQLVEEIKSFSKLQIWH